MIDVSVVIPTYNRFRQCQHAIESIDEPRLSVEVIVVDDASTDGTERVVSKREDVKYIRLSKNVGAAAARNTGIAAARGEFIAFLDSDDRRLPDTIADQVLRLRQDAQCVMSHAGKRYEGEDAFIPEIAGDVYDDLLVDQCLALSTTVIKKTVLKTIGGFNESYRAAEEWDLWLRLANQGQVSVLQKCVVVQKKPMDDSHLSGNPIGIERAATYVFRNHLASSDCRLKSEKARAEALVKFKRNRIDRMLWKVRHHPARNLTMKTNCLSFCVQLDAAYMMQPRNVKSAIQLFI